MNLFDAENGDAIDQYDAVFRFNSEWRRMHHVMKEKGVKFEDKRKYMGSKTTFRLVNRKYTTSLLDGDGASEDISSDEEVLFWNYFSAPYLQALQKTPKVEFTLSCRRFNQLGVGGVFAVEERFVLVRRRTVRVLSIHVFRRPRGFHGVKNVRRGGFVRV